MEIPILQKPLPPHKLSRPPLPLFRPPPPHLPSSGKSSSSDLPRREPILAAFPFPGPPEGVVRGPPEAGPPQKPANGSSAPADETAGKPKPKRVRKSRASGASQKRNKADPPLDANTAGTAESQAVASPPPKRRRAKATANDGNSEKPPPRRRNRQAANKGKTNEVQVVIPSSKESTFCTDPNYGRSESSTRGILGVYGLNTKALDLARYMKEISLEGLISGNLKANSSGDVPSSGGDVHDSFGTQLSSILEILAKPSSTELCKPRCASIPVKQVECTNQKLFLDLESTPLAEGEEGPSSLVDKSVQHCSHLKDVPDASAQENGKPLAAQSLFPVEALSLVPLTEFWRSLQLHPTTEPLEAFLSQAVSSVESRVSPSQAAVRAGGCNYKTESLSFPLTSAQAVHENVCDRYHRVNHWFRAGPSKQESSETWFGHLATAPQDNRCPIKAHSENGSGRLGQKEGRMEIDLNKQSPEAEAADTVKHSSTTRPETAHDALQERLLDLSGQARMETDEGKPQSAPLKEQEEGKVSSIDEQPDIGHSDARKVIDGCHLMGLPQKKEVQGEFVQDSYPMPVRDNVDREGLQCELTKDLPTCSSSGMPLLSVPPVHETQEFWDEVPFSPGVQAAAHLLCKMANSTTPFYIDKDEERESPFCSDTPSQRLSKAARIGGPQKIIHKHALDHSDGLSMKVQVGEGKNKLLSQVGNGYASAVEKVNSLIQSRERSSPSSRSVSKSTVTRMSGNQSSDSDKSPGHFVREHTWHTSTTESHQLPAVAVTKIPRPVKEGRGSNAIVSKVNSVCPTPSTAPSVFVRRKSTTVCETKQAMYGDGLTKSNHLHSNSVRNCLPPHRNLSYPVKPRNGTGCSVKSARQVLPLVEEVRQGAKRLF